MQEPVDPFGRDHVDQVIVVEDLRRPMYSGGFSDDALVAEIEAHAAAQAAIEAEAFAMSQVAAQAVSAEELAEQGYLREVTQAVSVAAAYFEDTLEKSPDVVLSAGSVSAQSLGAMLAEAGFAEMMDAGSRIKVLEVVPDDSLVGQAVSSVVPKGWLAGVRGALRS